VTSINIPEDAVRSIVSKAIMENLPQETKDDVIRQAVTSLITPPRDTYGRPSETPLQAAFSQAVHRAVHQIATEMVEQNPQVRQRIADLLGELTAALIRQDDEWTLRTKIAEAVTTAVINWRRE